MTYHFELLDQLDCEIAHYYDAINNNKIFSTGATFSVTLNGVNDEFTIPLPSKKRVFMPFRLTRRTLRLDKSNAVFNFQKDGVIVLYRGIIYFYNLKTKTLTQTGHLKNCRNVLHGGIAVTSKGLYFGEYGGNKERLSVPVWRSQDDGRSWDICYEFPAGSIKHVHGVYQDPYSDSLWVPTGDFAGECFVLEAKDPDFSNTLTHGDGTQAWRPVSMLFEPDHIIWPMDSQLETSYLQQFDRRTQRLQQHGPFPGPVWYSKRFEDELAVLQTTVEVGEGVKSDHAQIFASHNMLEWEAVARFRKDRWPMPYFKSGVLAFADGPQLSTDFLIFGEALKGMDGKTMRARIRRT